MTDRGLAIGVFIRDRAEQFRPTIRSLRAAFPGERISIASWNSQLVAAATEAFGDANDIAIETAFSAGELANQLAARGATTVIAVDDTVVVHPEFASSFDESLHDPRVVACCYLSNGAGYLSFPFARSPSNHQIGDHDEWSLADALAEQPTVAPVPVPFAAGGLVTFSGGALRTFPLVVAGARRLEAVAAEFSVRVAARSFRTMLDTRQFVSRPSDTTVAAGSSLLDDEEIAWIKSIHRHGASLLDTDPELGRAPFWAALTCARVKALGLRLVIDGTCLGPKEMGTQVQTLALIEHLAGRPEVASLGVALNGPVPPYAASALAHEKVVAQPCPRNDFSPFGDVDVIHRPFQPDLEFDAAQVGRTATRTVVTMQDVIAYQNAGYLPDARSWYDLRHKVRTAVETVDGVVAISHDTVEQLRLEGLPIAPDRLFVAENGVDHLRGDEPATVPDIIGRRRLVSEAFVTVIGANYGHKNRDLAIRAVGELRRRGHDLRLVVVGALVPTGSLRAAEARALDDLDRGGDGSDWIIPIADVSSTDRNWLLRHAALVLYPTSAEGFGLVPFESAVFGTPTVSVGFGPLDEVTPEIPVRAATWDPVDLADACAQLLDDPHLARRQVDAARSAASTYTWERTAGLLVDVYRTLLSRPAKEW